jgi:hypothetical protein
MSLHLRIELPSKRNSNLKCCGRAAQTIPEGCLGAVAQEALSPWPLKFEPLTSCGIATQTTRCELSEPPAVDES